MGPCLRWLGHLLGGCHGCAIFHVKNKHNLYYLGSILAYFVFGLLLCLSLISDVFRLSCCRCFGYVLVSDILPCGPSQGLEFFSLCKCNHMISHELLETQPPTRRI